MTFSRLLAPTLLLCSGASAQWLNYPDPAIPRLKDGKPNLSAPTPHTKDGKPDLTGVWMHERTTPEEITRIFGAAFEAELDASPIGMEAGTQHKYALNILLDFKPGESPLRPEAEAVMKRRAAELVQAPKETMILYEGG